MAQNWLVRLIGLSPLSVFHSGGLAVQIFFMLSGIVLSLSYFRKGETGLLTSAALRRYFRLMIPSLASILVVWVVVKAHGYRIAAAEPLMGHASGLLVPPDNFGLLSGFKLGTYDIFFNPDVAFWANPPLWTMPIELQGSFLIFAFLAFFGKMANRSLVYLIAAMLCVVSRELFLLDFLIGIVLCDTFVMFEKRKFQITFPTWMGGLGLAFGLFLGGLRKEWLTGMLGIHRSAAVAAVATGAGNAQHFPPSKPGMLGVAAAFFIITSIMFCPVLQRAFERKLFLLLGKISFPLYLFHIVVIYSLGCFVYVQLRVHAWSHLCSTMGASVMSIFVSLVVAWICYYAFDRPSIEVGRYFEKWIVSFNLKELPVWFRPKKGAVTEVIFGRLANFALKPATSSQD